MALSRPRWVSTWATAATSPIHDGVEGTDVGLTWIVTAGCVILLVCPPLWETVTYIYSLTRRHISSVLSSFSHVLLSYAISLRIPWVWKSVGGGKPKARHLANQRHCDVFNTACVGYLTAFIPI